MPAPLAQISIEVLDLVEVGILWLVLWLFFRFLRRTIAGGVFRGPAMVFWVALVALFVVLRGLELEVLAAIMAGAFPVFMMALIVLFQPEIPYNTGSVGRTCVALGAKLWLVRPLGFQIDDRQLRRAGLDYWQYLDWEVDLVPQVKRDGDASFSVMRAKG